MKRTSVRPSVSLSVPLVGGFAAERRAGRRCRVESRVWTFVVGAELDVQSQQRLAAWRSG